MIQLSQVKSLQRLRTVCTAAIFVVNFILKIHRGVIMNALFEKYIIEGLDSSCLSNYSKDEPNGKKYSALLKNSLTQVIFNDKLDVVEQIISDENVKCHILRDDISLVLLFNKTDINTKLIFSACGLKAQYTQSKLVKITYDVKDGSGNDVRMKRTLLNKCDFVEKIPSYFTPISDIDQKIDDPTQIGSDILRKYISYLKKLQFSKDDINATVKVINNHTIAFKLVNEEVDKLMLTDHFDITEFFGEKGKFKHNDFGDFILFNRDVLFIDDMLNIYTKDNVYSSDPKDFEKCMLELIPTLKDSQRKEVYKYISLQCKRTGSYSEPRYIGLKDCILDVKSMKTYDYSSDFIINNKIKYNYDKDAYSEVVDKTFDKLSCGDSEIRALMEEMVGYTLYRRNIMQTSFFLTGSGSNGKSTFLDMIKKLLGKQNISTLELKDLESRFKPAELQNKLANIGDDISAKYFEASSIFKKLVTGETFTVERKFGDPFELESYATMIFCANELPAVNDRTDGFSRRLTIIPFNAKFKNTDIDFDPDIEDKLQSDDGINYLLKLGVEGLIRIINNKQFTCSSKADVEKSQFIIDNNPVLAWIDECDPEIDGKTTTLVYSYYKDWCEGNGVKPMKQSNLSRELGSHFSYKTTPKYVDGATRRVYMKA